MTGYFRLRIDHLKMCITEGLRYREFRDPQGGRVYKFSELHAANIRAGFVGAVELHPDEVESLKPHLTFK